MTDIKAIRGRHHRVCTFCGGSPDDPHQAEWRDFYTCSCRDALCPQQLLDAAEARLLALARDAERLREAAEAASSALTAFEANRPSRQLRAILGRLDVALAEPKRGSGPPGKGPYDPDRIGVRVAALEGTDR